MISESRSRDREPNPDAIAESARLLRRLKAELGRSIVGQDRVIRLVLASALAEGHCLLIGVPGLAKTLLVRSVARLLSLDFRRIQFTPDLMPSDITGTSIIAGDRAGGRGLRFLRGPIFANIILADEVNRTPPKTQAALMEAMEERQVTATGRRMPLDRPFFVLATQNPIEQEGTYPLPVSQLDRFLLAIDVDYPSLDEEFDIVLRTTTAYSPTLPPLLSREEVVAMIAESRRVRVPGPVLEQATRLVRRSRPNEPSAPEFVRESISWGAGPRAVQAILQGCRALAFLDGRVEASFADLHEIALPALRHRLVRTYHAEAEGTSPDALVKRLLSRVPGAPSDSETPSSASLSRREKRGWFSRS